MGPYQCFFVGLSSPSISLALGLRRCTLGAILPVAARVPRVLKLSPQLPANVKLNPDALHADSERNVHKLVVHRSHKK